MTNGTAAGTHELTGITGASTGENVDGSGGLNPEYFAASDNGELFSGADTSGNFGLWVTNGTAAGTHEITGIAGAYTGLAMPRGMERGVLGSFS